MAREQLSWEQAMPMLLQIERLLKQDKVWRSPGVTLRFWGKTM